MKLYLCLFSLSLGWRTKLETIIFSELDLFIGNTYGILNIFIFSKLAFLSDRVCDLVQNLS